MEPCILWGKFLLEEREEYAFSRLQARACMGQQPSALSSKGALQPLPTTGLEEEAACQSGIQMASASWLPPRGGGLHRRHCVFSGMVDAEQNLTQEAEAHFYTDPARNEQEITAFAEAIKDECVSPPTSPCRHQRCFGHHHHVFDQVAGQVVVGTLTSRRSIRANDGASWLQSMLCPPKDEGHIPPVIYAPPSCGIFPKERYIAAASCSKIPVEGGVPEPLRR